MTISAFCYAWLISTSSGFERLKALSELATCLTNVAALMSVTKNAKAFLLELNGLCSIVVNYKTYGIPQLFSKPTLKQIRRNYMAIIASNYIVYLSLTIIKVGSLQFDFHNMLDMIGLIAGGVATSTLFTQTWIKMFLMIQVFHSVSREAKKMLEKRMKHPEVPEVQGSISKIIRLEVALVRNYKECSNFWCPAMVICQILTIGNLIVAFYVMIRAISQPWAGYSFDVHLQSRTLILIVGLSLLQTTQQRLYHVVSTVVHLFLNHCISIETSIQEMTDNIE